jgi:hypothetical protein
VVAAFDEWRGARGWARLHRRTDDAKEMAKCHPADLDRVPVEVSDLLCSLESCFFVSDLLTVELIVTVGVAERIGHKAGHRERLPVRCQLSVLRDSRHSYPLVMTHGR